MLTSGANRKLAYFYMGNIGFVSKELSGIFQYILRLFIFKLKSERTHPEIAAYYIYEVVVDKRKKAGDGIGKQEIESHHNSNVVICPKYPIFHFLDLIVLMPGT